MVEPIYSLLNNFITAYPTRIPKPIATIVLMNSCDKINLDKHNK